MNVQCHACIGGTNIGEDIRKLDYGQHVVGFMISQFHYLTLYEILHDILGFGNSRACI